MLQTCCRPSWKSYLWMILKYSVQQPDIKCRLRAQKATQNYYKEGYFPYWSILKDCSSSITPTHKQTSYPPPLCARRKKSNWWHPCNFTSLLPLSQTKVMEREKRDKKRRSRRDKMCFDLGRLPAHCYVLMLAEELKPWSSWSGADRRRQSKMAAQLHITSPSFSLYAPIFHIKSQWCIVILMFFWHK